MTSSLAEGATNNEAEHPALSNRTSPPYLQSKPRIGLGHRCRAVRRVSAWRDFQWCRLFILSEKSACCRSLEKGACPPSLLG